MQFLTMSFQARLLKRKFCPEQRFFEGNASAVMCLRMQFNYQFVKYIAAIVKIIVSFVVSDIVTVNCSYSCN